MSILILKRSVVGMVFVLNEREYRLKSRACNNIYPLLSVSSCNKRDTTLIRIRTQELLSILLIRIWVTLTAKEAKVPTRL
jgi:hypothetical protein